MLVKNYLLFNSKSYDRGEKLCGMSRLGITGKLYLVKFDLLLLAKIV